MFVFVMFCLILSGIFFSFRAVSMAMSSRNLLLSVGKGSKLMMVRLMLMIVVN